MATSTAHVPTALGARYLQQLCKHWSHRFVTRLENGTCTIDFGSGEKCTLASSDASLLVRLTAPAGSLEKLEMVVAEHLNRFAFREGSLAFDWQQNDAATVATAQIGGNG